MVSRNFEIRLEYLAKTEFLCSKSSVDLFEHGAWLIVCSQNMRAEWIISRISLRAARTPFPEGVCGRAGRSEEAATLIAEGHIPILLRRR